MSRMIDPERWPDLLDDALASCDVLTRVQVVRETGSTQDAARRMRARPGDVIVAWNQTGGRGRLGRAWSSGLEGVAVTFVLEPGQSERLAIAGAVAAALAAERFLEEPVGIKWPNDIVVGGRKLAGVLVEQDDERSLPAIGMNVAQASWPEDLRGKAVSLRQLGHAADRVEVAQAIITLMDASLRMDEASLLEHFARRDVLVGARLRVRQGSQVLDGELVRLDPLRGLALRTDQGEVVLSALTTTVLETILDAPTSGG